MRKGFTILALSLSCFSKSYSFVDFTCVSYMQDTFNHTYCVTYLDLSGCSPYAWSWYFDNGDSSDLPSPYSCFSYPGIYHVKLVATCQGGNKDSITHTLYVDSANIFCFYTGSAVIETNGFNSITVFPNPVFDRLIVQATNREPLQITLYDVLSRNVAEQTFTGSISINMQELQSGIYLYAVRNKSGIIKKGKVMVE